MLDFSLRFGNMATTAISWHFCKNAYITFFSFEETWMSQPNKSPQSEHICLFSEKLNVLAGGKELKVSSKFGKIYRWKKISPYHKILQEFGLANSAYY